MAECSAERDRIKLLAFLAERKLTSAKYAPGDPMTLGDLFEAGRRGGVPLQEMILFAGKLSGRDAVTYLLQGLSATSRDVRIAAGKALNAVAERLTIPAGSLAAQGAQKVAANARFSRSLLVSLRQKPDAAQQTFLFAMLMRIGGRGPAAAWRVLRERLYPRHVIAAMVRELPLFHRLLLVREYTRDKVQVRRHHSGQIRKILAEIEDREPVLRFLAECCESGGPLDPLVNALCERLTIRQSLVEKELRSPRKEERLLGIDAAGALGDPMAVYAALPLLGENEEKEVRLACLEMLAGSLMVSDPQVVNAVVKAVETDDWDLKFQAFKTLIALRAGGLGDLLSNLAWHYPLQRGDLYAELAGMGLTELGDVRGFLPEDQHPGMRAVVATEILKKDPERLLQMVPSFEKVQDPDVLREAGKLRASLQLIMEKEREALSALCQAPPALASEKKGFLSKLVRRKKMGLLKQFQEGEAVDDAWFNGEIFENLDLSGVSASRVNFDGARFSNVNFQGAELTHVSFRGCHFENVKMDGAKLKSATFEGAVLRSTGWRRAALYGCDFSESVICSSAFPGAGLSRADFSGGKILQSDFTGADLSETSFAGAFLHGTRFSGTRLYESDFTGASAGACVFAEGELSACASRAGADFAARSDLFESVRLSPVLCAGKGLELDWFNRVVLEGEVARQKIAFLRFNDRSIEMAMDIFRPEQGDLFELIPLLLHAGIRLTRDFLMVPYEGPKGICGYTANLRELRLAKSCFRSTLPPSAAGGRCDIEGLYTIGSIGSVAQTVTSDIDLWVCVDETALGKEGTKALSRKLSGIEVWAEKRFKTEVHFFLVDLKRVRKHDFGGSDQESSGSAQGKILKAEFYRAMILVAGRIPFWCVVPPWVPHRLYGGLYRLASRVDPDYVDLGDVSEIPKDEYFGAAVWQIFKSLKSPFKSVMKMGLLEKSIRTEGRGNLLCNRLKESWASGKADLKAQDPYIQLFREVYDYYRDTKSVKAEELLRVCFFIKLGLSGGRTPEGSVFGLKERIVQACIDNWCEDPKELEELSAFEEWSFAEIKAFSIRINNYMLETYQELGRTFRGKGKLGVISDEDNTILGRKMLAQFKPRPFKVEKMPLISHGRKLFHQLRFEHSESGASVSWALTPDKRVSQERGDNEREVLVRMPRLEEVLIWMIHNNLFLSTTHFYLVPNPTPVTTNDLHEVLPALHAFFPPGKDAGSEKELLETEVIKKLFIVVNLGVIRKKARIHEYAAIYLTSWGDLFCRVFTDEEGLISLSEILGRLSVDLGMPFDNCEMGGYIPYGARQRININF